MILLDTHAWVWWVSNPEQLSSRGREAIDNAAADNQVYISAISAWEVAALEAKGRLQLKIDASDWIARSEAIPFLNFVPIDNAIAIKSVRLAEFPHRDPADRIIVATALIVGATLVTKDRKIQEYLPVKSIW